MNSLTKPALKSIPKLLGDSIASFDLTLVKTLLKDDGEYQITNNEDEPVIVNKNKFIEWLDIRINKFKKLNPNRDSISYEIDQCLHCRIGNPVLIFENGKFPVRLTNSWSREKCGLMLEFDEDLVSSISLCFLFFKTDNPFLYEKSCPSSKRSINNK